MRVDDGRAIPTFISQAITNDDITIYGDGNQTRTFCYVDDLIEGIYKLLLHNYHLPVNLGNPKEITIKQLADEILSLIPQSRSKIIYTPLPVNDPKVRRPDISKAKKMLDWFPQTDRNSGLKKTIEYLKNNKLSNLQH
jgi:dTDP-glucose 4,6-dehydratase